MIDSRITGAYISRLRRDKDWTQMELADKLNVSHQAVSRWETGDSFPDIATLAQMASLFGVSVDELLNGGRIAEGRKHPPTGQVLMDMAQGRTADVTRLVQEDPANLEALIDAASLSRPSQLNDVVASLGDQRFTRDQVAALAPFITQQALSLLVSQMDVAGIDLADWIEFAPFLGREALDAVVRKVMPEVVTPSDLGALAPFLSRELCSRLAERLTADSIDGDELLSLAPFLDHEHNDRLALRLALGPEGFVNLPGLAPFLSQAVLDQLALQSGKLPLEELVKLAPFVSRAVLRQLFELADLQTLTAGQLLGLAPFLDRPALARLVDKVPVEELDAHTIVALAPFLDASALEALIRRK